MGAPPTSEREERFRTLLASKAMRVTEQRLAVLAALAQHATPATFPELVVQLRTSGLDRATVYRNLVSLSEVGILIRSQLADGVARYELPESGKTTHAAHPHLVCVDCGSATCLPPNAIRLQPDLSRRVTEIRLLGRCDACLK